MYVAGALAEDIVLTRLTGCFMDTPDFVVFISILSKSTVYISIAPLQEKNPRNNSILSYLRNFDMSVFKKKTKKN